jgi:hypothetical protein
MEAKGSSPTDKTFARDGWTPALRREFFGIRGFCAQACILAQNRSFFARGLGNRLRSLGGTASYGLNSAVDSPGAAMSALKGEGTG